MPNEEGNYEGSGEELDTLEEAQDDTEQPTEEETSDDSFEGDEEYINDDGTVDSDEVEEETLYAGKFRSAEDMEKAYLEAQKKITEQGTTNSKNTEVADYLMKLIESGKINVGETETQTQQETEEDLLVRLAENPLGTLEDIFQNMLGKTDSFESATSQMRTSSIQKLSEKYSIDEKMSDEIADTIENNSLLNGMLEEAINKDNYKAGWAPKMYDDVLETAYWVSKGKQADQRANDAAAKAKRETKKNSQRKGRLKTNSSGRSSKGNDGSHVVDTLNRYANV